MQLHGKIQALVEHARERVRRVESDRGQYRHHFAEKEIADPGALCFIPVGAAQKLDTLRGECGNDVSVEQLVLPGYQLMRLFAHQLERLFGGHAIGAGGDTAQLDLLFQTRHADLEKFVEIAADDAHIFQALQQRNVYILGLRQHTAVELEMCEFTVQELLGGEFFYHW